MEVSRDTFAETALTAARTVGPASGGSMRILLLDLIAFQCGGPCPTEKSVRVVTIDVTAMDE